MSVPIVLPASGGHTHGAADVRSATPTGAVLLDSGAWGQATAAGLAADAVTTAKIADDAVTGETGKHAIVTITNLGTSAVAVYPRAATASTANAALLYAAGGTAVSDRIPVAGERVKIVIAEGGDTKTGTFHVYVAE